MRLKIYILPLLLLFVQIANAQQLAIKWGDSYKNRKNSYITKIITEGPNSYYALRYSGGYVFSYIPHIWLDKYDAFSLKQDFSNEVSIPTRDGEPVQVEDIYGLKGTMLMLCSYINREANKKSVFAYTVDTTGKIGKNYREVDYIPLETRRDNRLEHIAVSADSSALMLFHTEYDAKTTNEKLVCRQIGPDLNEKFTKTVDIPYVKERVEVISGISDAMGNFYVMLRIADLKEGLFVKETKSYAYLLLCITAEGAVREYDMALGGPQVSEAMIKRAPDGNILVAGFYTNQSNTGGGIAGTFYIRIDGKTGGVMGKGINAFDKDFLQLFLNNRKIDKGVELTRYKLNDFILKPNQGAILVAEQEFEDLVCFYDTRTGIQTCNNHYYFNDIIVASLGPDGAVEWVRKIPKQQETINDGGVFSSYLLARHQDKLYFIFNDNVRNFEYMPQPIGVLPPPGQLNQPIDPFNMVSPQKAQVALVEVDSTGMVTKKPFFSAKDNKIIIRPRLSYRANEDVTIIYGEYSGHFRFGKLIFKNNPAEE